MNAKKIMGAVLVALLAAALFVGAGAADDKGTVFINQKNAPSTLEGTWTLGTVATVIIDSTGAVTSDNFVEGTYKKGSDTLTIKNPSATIKAMGKTSNNEEYKVGTLFKGDSLTISATPVALNMGASDIAKIIVTYPNGDQKLINSGDELWDATASSKVPVGQYTVQVMFDDTNFVTGTPESSLITAAYTFTVVKATAELSVAAAEVTVGDFVKVSISGKPGQTYVVDGYADLFNVGTSPYPFNNGKITLPNDGKAYINLVAKDDGTATITIKKDAADAETESKLTIKVVAGTVTIEADKDAYFLGDKVTLSGIVTGGDLSKAVFTMKGQNYNKDITSVLDPEIDGNNWTAEFTTNGAVTDAGTYTITLNVNGEKASTSVALKQPFISVTDAPSVAVQGTDYIVTGTAEAATSATNVMVYVFGTNYFAAGNGNINTTIEGVGKIGSVEVEDNEFTIKLTELDGMDAGQYFMVIQHPMYNTVFNIAPKFDATNNVTGAILLNTSASALAYGDELFNVEDRQKTNAAQALCDELDAQKIDDRYVKLSFIVAAGSSTINPIPSEITQGSKLTVSGQTNIGGGKLVTVEMISTAFAAQPKETVGSASFITLTTKTNDDGTWEITFDTTGLNVDEYTVSAMVEGFDGTTTAKVNVIEGAPTENPTEQPTQTEQPTEQPTETEAPATPGFGALAALAGLGAVAVLLLRRE